MRFPCASSALIRSCCIAGEFLFLEQNFLSDSKLLCKTGDFWTQIAIGHNNKQIYTQIFYVHYFRYGKMFHYRNEKK